LHLEGLMTTFMLTALFWLVYYLRNSGSKTPLIVSAFFAALAVLTKSSALFIAPFGLFTIFLLTELGNLRERLRQSLEKYLKWLLFIALFFVLLWPAMWVAPLKALNTYFFGVFEVGVEGGHQQLYFGKLVEDPGISFYPVALFYRSSPYLVFGLLGLSLFLVRKRTIPHSERNFLLLTFLFAVFYLVELVIPSKKLDRYILPSLAALSLLSSYFWVHFSRKYLNMSILLALSWMFGLLALHPDYLSYYNPLGGGLRKGIYVLEPKWLIGERQIENYFMAKLALGEYEPFAQGESLYNTKSPANKIIVAFPEKYYTQVWPFVRRIGGWAVIESLGQEASKATFFVFPVWDDYSAFKRDYVLEKESVIKIRGVAIYNVYKKTR
ncbi:hypothetical protein HY419_01545, partial [candidate division WWE3 bacterium]|nr:hypothetical protein [candidate division WWE3 bacterium]